MGNTFTKVVGILLILNLLCSTFAYAIEFVDVSEENPYKEAINYLSGMGIMIGYENDIFRPDGLMTKIFLRI